MPRLLLRERRRHSWGSAVEFWFVMGGEVIGWKRSSLVGGDGARPPPTALRTKDGDGRGLAPMGTLGGRVGARFGAGAGASDVVVDVVTLDSRALSDCLTRDSPELREYADKMLLIESVGEGGSGWRMGAGVAAGADSAGSGLRSGLRAILIVVGAALVDDGGIDGRGALLSLLLCDGKDGRLGRYWGGGGSTADLFRSGTAGRAFEKRDRPLLGGSEAGACNMVNAPHPESNLRGNARRNKGVGEGDLAAVTAAVSRSLRLTQARRAEEQRSVGVGVGTHKAGRTTQWPLTISVLGMKLAQVRSRMMRCRW
jgi:hypothetical protein